MSVLPPLGGAAGPVCDEGVGGVVEERVGEERF
eukprot:CAMPEP_0116947478 /NCGR_PEP_ID=MMETSP0467-20121206/37693_1 /TAXON_ID=283647 /ORGANISM="Mesodinium pulex, Strain SPMC105" /LENGTH=32 /DNA_ID= /DNA_START= /DNA_END= /DNA_ORIENTATION=